MVFYFPLYAKCKKLSDKVPYMILVQFKYFTLRHVCYTLDNKIIQKQNISDLFYPWIFSVLNHDACIFRKDVCNLVNPVCYYLQLLYIYWKIMFY